MERGSVGCWDLFHCAYDMLKVQKRAEATAHCNFNVLLDLPVYLARATV